MPSFKKNIQYACGQALKQTELVHVSDKDMQIAHRGLIKVNVNNI